MTGRAPKRHLACGTYSHDLDCDSRLLEHMIGAGAPEFPVENVMRPTRALCSVPCLKGYVSGKSKRIAEGGLSEDR
jgi:hypothetical protein